MSLLLEQSRVRVGVFVRNKEVGVGIGLDEMGCLKNSYFEAEMIMENKRFKEWNENASSLNSFHAKPSPASFSDIMYLHNGMISHSRQELPL